MAKHILVPTDGSPQSVAAQTFAAGEWPDADITVLTVIDPVELGYSTTVMPSGSEEWYEREKARAQELFEEAEDRLGREVGGRVEVGRPSRTIVEVAGEDEYDHIVMGSHGREGVSRIILGSVAEHVIRRSPVPVTVVR